VANFYPKQNNLMTEISPLDEFSLTKTLFVKQIHKLFYESEVQRDHCVSLNVFIPYLNKH
jgi:hypothetical protein